MRRPANTTQQSDFRISARRAQFPTFQLDLGRFKIPILCALSILYFATVAVSETPHSFLTGRIVDVLEKPRFSQDVWGEISLDDADSNRIFASDFTGDSKSDLLLFNGLTSSLVLLEAHAIHSFKRSRYPVPLQGSLPIGSGDVSGDGCADLLLWDSRTLKLTLGISRCKDGGFLWDAPITLTNVGSILEAHVEEARNRPRGRIFLSSASDGKIYWLNGERAEEYRRLYADHAEANLQLARPIILADVNNDGALDSLSTFKAAFGEAWFVTGAASTSRQYASLPEYYSSATFLPIELNGDKRRDFLVYPGKTSLLGWFAVLSTDSSGIERSIETPFSEVIDASTIRAGDFTGDGLEDLVGFDALAVSSSRKIRVASRIPPRGIAGVRVSSDEPNGETESDSTGEFRIPAIASTATWKFSKTGFVFEPNEIVVQSEVVASGHILIAGEDLTGHSARGRSLGILGDPPGPYVCNGYHQREGPPTGPDVRAVQMYSRWRKVADECPGGYAILNLGLVQRNFNGSIKPPLHGTCCRLPSADVLTNDHQFQLDECPDGTILTGFKLDPGSSLDRYMLRCTAINSNRYELGPKSGGTFWGYSLVMRNQRGRIPLSKLPLAVRIGYSREIWQSRGTSGCSGGPSGSLFVGITGESCAEHQVRELRYVGAPGDPPKGTAVQLFPMCSKLDDPYDPLSGCR